MSKNTHNIGNYIEDIHTYLEFAKNRLEDSGIFRSVELFTGTSFSTLFDLLPTLNMPSAVIMYTGSSYSNNPRRTSEIAVLVITRDISSFAKVEETAQGLADKVISALDHEGDKQFVFKITSDRAIEFENTGVASYDMRFDVEDF